MADKKFWIEEKPHNRLALCHIRYEDITVELNFREKDFEALEKCIISFGSDKGRIHSGIRGIKSRLLALIDEKILTLEYHDKDGEPLLFNEWIATLRKFIELDL